MAESTPLSGANGLDFDALRPSTHAIKPEHIEWRGRLRDFVEQTIAPHLDDWNSDGTFPDSVYKDAAAAGILGMGFPEEHGGALPNADLYHRVTMAEELHRLGSGVVFGDLATHWIALPPVIAQNSDALFAEVVKPILRGDKKIAFAVTEPGGGSDVSRLTTAAVPTTDGWRVSGSKTLISGVMRADYVLTAVRTADAGMRGISLLLIDTSLAGVTREPVAGLRWYNRSVGTIAFDNTPVSSDYLIGPENEGFIRLLPQFNIERFSSVAAALAMCRVSLAEAIAFARQRQVFGKLLIEQQSIRHRLVDQIRAIRVAYAFLDRCIERFQEGSDTIADLGLLKIQATTTLESCARECLHIMGGSAYQGSARLERIQRESRIFALGGGTEEVLKDLVGRQLKL